MDNTEGSRAITSVFRARKNLQLKVSHRQMSILLGSILGDAYVYPQGKICIEHAQSQEQYLRWKYAELESIAYPKVARVARIDKRTSTQTISWRFFLRQFFRPLRTAFYTPNGTKTVPPELRFWITPLLLAVWYMDDGHLDRKKYPEIMTESFSQSGVLLLIRMLQHQFGLKSAVTSKNRLRILSNSKMKFFSLIEPHIHEDLEYKLP